jgi:3-phenylpropionate/trans-cinnamate dioxygenase ferredoxin reductase subunit
VNRVVIVGASLAGYRAAEHLRRRGFDGTVSIVGDEPHQPYDRPPLSKAVLAGRVEPEQTALRSPTGDELDVDWVLGESAVALDLAGRRVDLASGTALDYDGLVIATGATPRRLPFGHDKAGVHVLRSLDDCIALRADLDATPGRVVVVGAGFIGAEVAATCRGRGLDVTVVEPLPVPLARALPEEIGGAVARMHLDHGVDLRLNIGIDDITGGDLTDGVVLSDGSRVDADVVVVGVGVVPNTGWLEGSGLTIDNGVVCDETCLAAPGVVAAGDVARWPNRRFGEVMRVEHWDNAVAMGAAAAERLLAGDGPGEAFEPVPWFWSDQYNVKLQLAGRASRDHDQHLIGSTDDERFAILFGRDGQLTGCFAWKWPRELVRFQQMIEQGTTWSDAVAAASE